MVWTPTGVAAEGAAEDAEHPAVELVEADGIDAEDVERRGGDLEVDPPGGTHLGVVTSTPEQAVDDARGAAGAAGDHLRAVRVEVDPEQPRRAVGDRHEVVRVVEVEAEGDAEPITQRRAERARPASSRR